MSTHVARVVDAQDRLLKQMLGRLPQVKQEAESEGKSEADILVFDGMDTFENYFFYLYLLKPPIKGPPPPGFQPLLHRLQTELHPLQVTHVWEEGTRHNRIVVSWENVA